MGSETVVLDGAETVTPGPIERTCVFCGHPGAIAPYYGHLLQAWRGEVDLGAERFMCLDRSVCRRRQCASDFVPRGIGCG